MEFDFAAKEDIEFAAIMTPENAPAAFQDRETLWNAAEKAEGRKDAVPARELLVSLPHELDFKQRQELVRDFVSQHVIARGMVADIALHRPGKQGDHSQLPCPRPGDDARRRACRVSEARPPEWWSAGAGPRVAGGMGQDPERTPAPTPRAGRAAGVASEPCRARRRPRADRPPRAQRDGARAQEHRVGTGRTEPRCPGAKHQGARDPDLDYQDTADRIAKAAAPIISVPLPTAASPRPAKVRDRMVAERDGWAAERAALAAPRVATRHADRARADGGGGAARALAKARLSRTEERVAKVRSKRLQLVQWVSNPARMIWAKHAELNAIARARAEFRRAHFGLQVRQDWARSAQGQAFIANRAASRVWKQRPTRPASGGRWSERSSGWTIGSPQRPGPSTTYGWPTSSVSASFACRRNHRTRHASFATSVGRRETRSRGSLSRRGSLPSNA